MVMGPEQPGSNIDCNRNYRPVLSSDRALLHVRIKTFSDREKKIWSWTPKCQPTPKNTGRLTVDSNFNSTQRLFGLGLCEGLLKHFHSSPVSRKRRPKVNPV